MRQLLLLFFMLAGVSAKAQLGKFMVPGAPQLRQLVGRVDTVYGQVAGVMHLRTPGLTLLMIGDSFPNQPLTVVIKDGDLKKFRPDPERAYQDAMVKIVGKVELYQGKLQINVKDSTALQPIRVKVIGHDRPDQP